MPFEHEEQTGEERIGERQERKIDSRAYTASFS
jgi:hypothetical protein